MSQITFKSNSVTRMTTTKQYDFLNRLTQISSVPSGTGILPVSFNYNYNLANQRTKDVLADGSYWIYQYDSLGQATNGVKYFYDGTLVPFSPEPKLALPDAELVELLTALGSDPANQVTIISGQDHTYIKITPDGLGRLAE